MLKPPPLCIYKHVVNNSQKNITKQIEKRFLIILGILTLLVIEFFISKKINLNPNYDVGQKIDSLNGGVGNVEGRVLAEDGYNIELKYQCVEFVKRYYYEELNHKMPDT